MRTALILLFLLAVASVPGSLVPQDRVDPSAVFAFKERHPQLTPVFEWLGMFDVYSSVWFSAIYVLLMLSLVGCIIPRLRVYLRGVRARPPKAPSNLSRLSAYDCWTVEESVAALAGWTRDLLRRQRRRVEVYDLPGGGVVVSAEKGFSREAGNLLFHVALLVVLVGVAITGLFGFRGAVAVIRGDGFSNTLIQYDEFTPGAGFDIADLAPFTFTVDDFEVEWEESGPGAGTPTDFDATLSVTPEPGAPSYRYRLGVNDPLKVGGASVYLVGHGYAPMVTVRDGDGNMAYDGPVVFLPQDGSFLSYGVVKAPDASPTQLAFEGYFFPTAAMDEKRQQPYSAFPDALNPVLSLVAYQGDLGLDSGAPQSVYTLDKTKLDPFTMDNGQPEALLLREGKTVELEDGAGSITFNGYERWVNLQVNRAPGKVVPLAGVIAAIIGLLFSLFVRPRRTWVRIRPADGHTLVEVAALDRVPGGDPRAHVTELTSSLRKSLSASSPTPSHHPQSGEDGSR
jgi:cytochrome c biogenesis protein